MDREAPEGDRGVAASAAVANEHAGESRHLWLGVTVEGMLRFLQRLGFVERKFTGGDANGADLLKNWRYKIYKEQKIAGNCCCKFWRPLNYNRPDHMRTWLDPLSSGVAKVK